MHQAQHALRNVIAALRGPQLALLALAFGLALLWFGPAALALGLPFALMLLPRGAARGTRARPRTATTGQMTEMATALDHRLRAARRAHHPVLCITLAIRGFDGVQGPLGDRVVTTCLDRLSHGLRREDALYDLGAGRLGIIPDGARGLDDTSARRLAARLEAHATAALGGIRGAEALRIATGLCLEAQPGTRNARAMIAEALAAANGNDPGNDNGLGIVAIPARPPPAERG
jgi:GGDEF domain-containing protein